MVYHIELFFKVIKFCVHTQTFFFIGVFERALTDGSGLDARMACVATAVECFELG